MKYIKFSAVILMIFVLFSCNKITVHNIPALTENIPVVTNVEDAYTYTINADAFSDSLSKVLNFSTTESVITYTVLNYSQGSVDLKIDDSASTIIYNDMIESNIVIVENLRDRPQHIEMVLNNFSGMFELAMASDN
ncbi:hypothetical protein D4R71_02950 [bacterium]|nr:MAG: hypothetical protein D4R71_02950 [bacterium]